MCRWDWSITPTITRHQILIAKKMCVKTPTTTSMACKGESRGWPVSVVVHSKIGPNNSHILIFLLLAAPLNFFYYTIQFKHSQCTHTYRSHHRSLTIDENVTYH